MLLHRLAAGLVFVAALGLLRLSVHLESWPLLGIGLGAAVTGLTWFVLASPGRATENRWAIATPR